MDLHKKEAGIGIDNNLLFLLGGFSLFLATIELMIPKPMPFLKLGIANLPILLFIRLFSYRELLQLVFLKVFCFALISGSMFSYIVVFSACASFVSCTGMWLIGRLPSQFLSVLGISIFGAGLSNAVQLVLSLSYFFPGTGSILIPWFLGFGMLSGFFLGVFALQFAATSSWCANILYFLQNRTISIQYLQKSAWMSWRNVLSLLLSFPFQKITWNVANKRFVIGVFSLMILFLLNELEPLYIGLQLLFFILLNMLLHYRPWWCSILVLMTTIIFFHLLLPTGKVLYALEWMFGYVKVTQGALLRGLSKAFFLLALIQISRFSISKELKLPGYLGKVIRRVFYCYKSFLNCPVRFQALHPFASLDAILMYIDSTYWTEEQAKASSELVQEREHASQWKMKRIDLMSIVLIEILLLVSAYLFPLHLL